MIVLVSTVRLLETLYVQSNGESCENYCCLIQEQGILIAAFVFGQFTFDLAANLVFYCFTPYV